MAQLIIFYFLFGTFALGLTLLVYHFFDMFIDWLVQIFHEIINL